MAERVWWRRLASGAPRHIFLMIVAVGALFPVYFMLSAALKSNTEYAKSPLGLPTHPTFSHFADAFHQSHLARGLINSLILTSSSVALSTAIAALGAYAMVLLGWRTGPKMLGLMIALMVIPPIVLVIPLYALLVQFGIEGTRASVIVIYTGLLTPFSAFLLASFFRTVPQETLEAAKLDGASIWQTFWRVVIPMTAPAIATVVVVQALWVWNEVLVAVVFLQDEPQRTLVVDVTLFRSRYQVDTPIVMAGMLIATLPTVALYFAGQRFFVRGLAAGGSR